MLLRNIPLSFPQEMNRNDARKRRVDKKEQIPSKVKPKIMAQSSRAVGTVQVIHRMENISLRGIVGYRLYRNRYYRIVYLR